MCDSQNTPPEVLDLLLGDVESTANSSTLSQVSGITVDDFSIPDIVSLTTNNREVIRACIFTVFPPNQDKKWLLPETYFQDTTGLLNWAGQFERAPDTNILHVHIFMEWDQKKPRRFSTLRKLLQKVTGKNGDIQKTKKLSDNSRNCCANYVLKPDTWVNGEETRFVWPHNKHDMVFNQELFNTRQKKSVKRSKEEIDEERRVYIETKPRWWTWEQIVHESTESKSLLCTCSWGKTYHAGRHAEIPRRNIQDVIILYGAGGTGKTTLAHSWDVRTGEDQQERYYRRNPDDGHFWGGGRTAYKGQRIIHLEEFCGQERLSTFKEICDLNKPGPNVNIKNGGVSLNHDTVLISSNHHPAQWYHRSWDADPKQFHPFWRRITQVWFFPPHRDDGSPNVPDGNNPPYYIDQTDAWKNMEGDYNEAMLHANVHWPMKEETSFNPPNESINEFNNYCQTGRRAGRG
ncbi:MAG: replication associated protein [Avonheates virus SG_924]|uniref:replication associated protein n=1 Tax=Avonheates virus SG_924 TaxID=2914488 RepID=UPI002481E77F|nr:MAG: replication associated protein [Avonheates virus SG_924]UNI72605.1 MAG: replication associated protein [Avonheates virus SG_924]